MSELQEAILLLTKASLHCTDQETIEEIDNFIFWLDTDGKER